MFIQPDWFEVTKAGVGTNRYAYSGNDPVNFRDPGGNVNIGTGGAGDPGKGAKSGIAGFFAGFFGGGKAPKSLDSPNGVENETFSWKDSSPTQHRERGIDGETISTPSKAAQRIAQIKEDHPDEPVNLFGHSWGGPAVVSLANELAKMGIEVDNVITIDPVSRLSRPSPNRDGGTNYHNFYVPSESRTRAIDDRIAKAGLPWGKWSKADTNSAITNFGSSGGRVGGHMAILGSDQFFGILSEIFGD